MDRRVWKQLFIALVVLIIATGTALVVWRFTSYRAPSCYDHVKNQDEVDVDCGGVCAPCTALPSPLRIRGAEIVEGERGTFDVVFSLENPNVSWGVASLPYTVVLRNVDGGTIVGERKGETFLLPLEVRPVVEQAITPSASVASKPNVTVVLGDPRWVETPNGAADAGLLMKEETFTRLPTGPDFAEVRGIVENSSPFSYDRIEVEVIVRNREGTLVGVRRTEMRTLGPRERREFRVAWRQPFTVSGEPDVSVHAFTNVFLNENFIRAHGVPERFQELRDEHP
jgi:hypothetical protein